MQITNMKIKKYCFITFSPNIKKYGSVIPTKMLDEELQE